MNDIEAQKIFDKLKLFHKMYDMIRFVDPVKKKTVTYKKGKIQEDGIKCFDFMETGKICDNCISIRAFQDDKSFVKIEYVSNKIYLITAVPIVVGDRRVVIELFKNATESMVYENNVTNRHEEIYSLIDNMNQIALIDSLTSVYNRRYINEKLPIDVLNAAITEKSYSLIMTDIDWFKHVNDNYGHLGGDEVLKVFAEMISKLTRKDGDWVARYGGEEFLICLPETEHNVAVDIAERMRKEIESKEILYDEFTIKITSSFGVYTFVPQEDTLIEDIIKKADENLYCAKRRGRNRVEG